MAVKPFIVGVGVGDARLRMGSAALIAQVAGVDTGENAAIGADGDEVLVTLLQNSRTVVVAGSVDHAQVLPTAAGRG